MGAVLRETDKMFLQTAVLLALLIDGLVEALLQF